MVWGWQISSLPPPWIRHWQPVSCHNIIFCFWGLWYIYLTNNSKLHHFVADLKVILLGRSVHLCVLFNHNFYLNKNEGDISWPFHRHDGMLGFTRSDAWILYLLRLRFLCIHYLGIMITRGQIILQKNIVKYINICAEFFFSKIGK